VGKCSKKAWRELRTAMIAQPHMQALKKAVESEQYTKVTWKDVNQSRFWIQKKKFSTISDSCKQVFETAQIFKNKLKPTQCYDLCTYAASYYRLVKLGEKLAKDTTEFFIFTTWVKQVLLLLTETTTPVDVAKAFEKICLQVWSDEHKCSGTCYQWVGEQALKKPALSATTAMFGRAPTLYYNPFGRVLLDAMNRVDSGSMTSSVHYKYELYKKVIDFAAAFKLYDPNVGGKLELAVMAMTGFPEQPKIVDPEVLELWKLAEKNGICKKGSPVLTISGGFGEAAAGVKDLVARALGQNVFDHLGKNAYHAATDAALAFGTSGAATGGALVDRTFQAVGNWVNAKIERRALAAETAKDMESRDLSKMLTALRTLLKDEGKFETFGEQFGKLTVHLDRFLELKAQPKLKNCQEAYDLAVATFEVEKHWEKCAESLELLSLFSDIVDHMVLATQPVSLELVEEKIAEATEEWFSKHPRNRCKGVCYEPTEAEFVEMVDAEGNVVGVESWNASS
jgi:hypothetical protein